MTDEELDGVIELAMDELSETGDDTDLMTQAQSAEFYENIATQCAVRAHAIREEMR